MTTAKKAPVRRRNTAVAKEEAEVKDTEEKVEKVEEVAEEEVEVKDSTPKRQPNVRIKTNKDYRTFIGDRWFNFKKGVEANVPAHVKEILYKAGVLDTL